MVQEKVLTYALIIHNNIRLNPFTKVKMYRFDIFFFDLQTPYFSSTVGENRENNTVKKFKTDCMFTDTQYFKSMFDKICCFTC